MADRYILCAFDKLGERGTQVKMAITLNKGEKNEKTFSRLAFLLFLLHSQRKFVKKIYRIFTQTQK